MTGIDSFTCRLRVVSIITAVTAITASIDAQNIVSLPPTSAGISVTEFYGEAEDDEFGISIDSAGDFNFDGVPDVVIGAALQDTGNTDGGAGYLFLGGGNAGSAWDFRILAESRYDRLGEAVCGIGRFDDDQYHDIAISAINSDRVLSNQGAVWVVFGSSDNFGGRQMVIDGIGSANAAFGFDLAAGDFNNDGYDDLAVGTPYHGQATPFDEEGRVDIFLGSTSPDKTPDMTAYGGDMANHFGTSVSCAGDVNCDGFDDLVVGEQDYYTYNPDFAYLGKAVIFYGGSPLNNQRDLEVIGEEDSLFGHSVAGIGDINNDTCDDVAIGAPWYPLGTGAGRVYILFGGPGMDNVPDIIIDGEAVGDQFGWSIDGGRDLNGDGYSDMIVGARYSDLAADNSGAVYVYYGGPAFDTIPDLVIGATHDDDSFGYDVAMLGDWTGTGTPLAAGSAIWFDRGGSSNEAYGALFAFGLNELAATGDMDSDGDVDGDDIDTLWEIIKTTIPTPPGVNPDLNHDDSIDTLDMDVLIHNIIGTEYGDANLSGKVDAPDLVRLIVNYGSSFTTSKWCECDFNGDGYINAPDLTKLIANYGKP